MRVSFNESAGRKLKQQCPDNVPPFKNGAPGAKEVREGEGKERGGRGLLG